MDTKDLNTLQNNESDSSLELLKELTKNSRKQLFYSRLTTLAAMLAAIAVIICMVIVVPSVMRTVKQANNIMAQVSETIELADTAIESITDMSLSITNMGNNMDTFITENAESVQKIMKKFDEIDFEGLNRAIKDLGDVVEPFANFFGKFK